MKAGWLCLVLIGMAVIATTMSTVEAQGPIKYINLDKLCNHPGGCPPNPPNHTPRQAANPYRRGCLKINRCHSNVD
ncbi:unnamed protein product [Camellia sinensis]|uniref:Rapid ALkalinization Factor n=1 Tax=Camellia sinensis TaxID=4442 RepID=A0A7J7GNN0_CAMSI|nr:hypothetical protein HYC85_019497 [Camellia sinensis]